MFKSRKKTSLKFSSSCLDVSLKNWFWGFTRSHLHVAAKNDEDEIGFVSNL